MFRFNSQLFHHSAGFLSLPFCLILLACNTGSELSGDYATNDIHVDYDIYIPSYDAYFRQDSNPTSTSAVSALFYVDAEEESFPLLSDILDYEDTIELRLTHYDYVRANDGATDKYMFSGSASYNYTTTFTTTYSGSTDFTLTFERENSEDIVSTVNIPEIVSLTTPTAGQSFIANSDSIVLNWTGSSSALNYTVELVGPCVTQYSTSVPAGATSLTIPPGTLTRSPQSTDTACEAILRIKTSLSGTVNSQFKPRSTLDVYIASVVGISLSGL